MYHLKVGRSISLQYHGSCDDRDAYGRLQSGQHYLSGRPETEHAFYPGIPLREKDRTCGRSCKACPYRIRYDERQGRKAFQDQRRRCYAPGVSPRRDQ